MYTRVDHQNKSSEFSVMLSNQTQKFCSGGTPANIIHNFITVIKE